MRIVKESSRFSNISAVGRNNEVVSMQEFEVQEIVLLEQEEIELQNELNKAKVLLFPEKELDIFDEITMEDVNIKWDFNLSTLLQRSINNKARALNYVDIEKSLQVVSRNDYLLFTDI